MPEITIYTDIDSATGFGPQMLRDALAVAAGKPVKVRLNSEGGNVIDGLACHNLLRDYPGETTVTIDGMALSIASLVACAGDTVQMAENSWFMLHNPHNQAAGDGDDLRDMAALLDGMRDQLANVYTAKSKKPKEEILQLMDAETWLTGPQALEAGFVDEVTASLEVAAEFDASRFSRPPQTTQAQKETVAMTAASYQELKAAFPRAGAEFLTGCLDRGHTLDKARAEYDEQTAKALEEKTKEADETKAEFEQFKKKKDEEARAEEEEKKEAEAKAKAAEEEEEKAAEAKGKTGVKAAASGKTKAGHTAKARFTEAVNDRVSRGLSRAEAVADTVHERPDLQQEFLEEAHAGRE